MKRKKPPYSFSKKITPKPSKVYDTYWHFATERQRIFYNRWEGQEFPWTEDEILLEHKFTNAYRAADRVSQYLIREVQYAGSQDPTELFFRTILFKLFNRISTWEYLEAELGELSWTTYDFERYSTLLTEAMEAKARIYSPAYIMASGRSAFGFAKKHQNHLRLLEKMLNDGVPQLLQESTSMRQGYELLLSYPAIGAFLAYQFITDINYSPLTAYSETEFVKAGPGALGGLSKCFSSLGDYTPEEAIQWVAERQAQEFEKRGLEFQTLWGRPLQWIDCQNLFCEVDKYARVAHPDVAGISDRKRIKQKFAPEPKPAIDYFFPPDWGINEQIKRP